MSKFISQSINKQTAGLATRTTSDSFFAYANEEEGLQRGAGTFDAAAPLHAPLCARLVFELVARLVNAAQLLRLS